MALAVFTFLLLRWPMILLLMVLPRAAATSRTISDDEKSHLKFYLISLSEKKKEKGEISMLSSVLIGTEYEGNQKVNRTA